MALLDLPVDILYLIIPHLDVPSFVSLTSSCKPLRELSEDPAFWSSITRSTFRVPNQPVVSHDGKRWRSLYKRLLTQSRVYTWGSNAKANLGHSFEPSERLATLPPAMQRRRALRTRNVSWATEMENYHELGIIADLQAGGWSTSLLTSKGALYTVGVMNGLFMNNPPYYQEIHSSPTTLSYPPGFTHPADHYDPSTAIRQFSAGRSHVLGLSDSGRIWSWNNIDEPGYCVKFLDIDLTEGDTPRTTKVGKVVAGWDKSAALISGVGIVVWDVLSRNRDETEVEDTALVLQSAIVPDTAFRRKRFSTRAAPVQYQPGQEPPDDNIGEVLNFILLERFVVFNTSTGKVLAGEIVWNDEAQHVQRTFSVPLPTVPESSATEVLATDVQGSFHNFAIFIKDGAVLTGTQDYLEQLLNPPTSPHTHTLVLDTIPALQQNNVIALAFGDYHFHALHSSGTITSYGSESQGCGSLGLGGNGPPEGRLRGIRYSGVGGDGRLVPHASLHGRQVWFEREKQDWIRFLVSGARDPQEAADRLRMCAETAVQGEVSEWVEQEGRAWEERFLPFAPVTETDEAEDDDGLSAYFALSVTAAGWHSGALVLVNEAKAARIREGCLVRRPQQAEDPDLTPEPESSESTPEAETTSSSTLSSTISWLLNNVRWALGYAPSSSAAQASSADLQVSDPANSRPIPPHSSLHFTNPVMHGAALDQETPYRWADDSFPRLRLSDGREMPGSIGFHEFRDGRPDWSGVALR